MRMRLLAVWHRLRRMCARVAKQSAPLSCIVMHVCMQLMQFAYFICAMMLCL